MNITKTYLWMAMAVLMLLAGCATKRNVYGTRTTKQKTEKTHPTEVIPEPKPREITLQEKVIMAQPDFQTAVAQKARFSINYQQRQISANGTISLIKDSILIVSVQPLLGIELFRVEATPTEVVIVDKMNRRYNRLTYEKAAAMARLENLQALAMNKMFVVGQPQSWLIENAITAGKTDDYVTIAATYNAVDYTYTVNPASLKLTGTTITLGKEQMSVNYGAHTDINGVVFPAEIDVTYTSSRMQASGHITLPNVVFNGTVNANRISLSKYKQVDLTSILSGK